MTIGETVGFDCDAIADDALDREAAVIDLRRNAFDDRARATLDR
jgi:hypothetical protein